MIQDDIKKFFRGEVLSNDQTLEKYSHDYSIFAVTPQVVVFPKNADDVKKLTAFVSAQRRRGEHISITARSAGTDMTGGPLNDSIIVDFTKHINRIKQIGRAHV